MTAEEAQNRKRVMKEDGDVVNCLSVLASTAFGYPNALVRGNPLIPPPLNNNAKSEKI